MVEWKDQFLEMLEFSITGKVNGSRLCYLATNGRHLLFIFWIYLLYLLLKNQTGSTEVKLLVYSSQYDEIFILDYMTSLKVLPCCLNQVF